MRKILNAHTSAHTLMYFYAQCIVTCGWPQAPQFNGYRDGTPPRRCGDTVCDAESKNFATDCFQLNACNPMQCNFIFINNKYVGVLLWPRCTHCCCRLLLAVCIGCFCCCHNNISDFNQICSWQRCRAVHSTKGHCENKEDLLFAYCTAQRFVLSKWVICCMQRLHKYITPLHLWRVKVIELLWESLSNCFMLMQ